MADSRVRIGMVGLNFGRHVVNELLAAPANQFMELAAVCDLDAKRLAEIAQKTGARPYNDLDEMLRDPSIDAIGLYTGPNGRAALIRKIIRAGKHVMTTKPFELDPQAARDVLIEAQQLNKVVHLNSPGPLASSDLQQIVAWQDQYKLGRPVAFRRETWASYRESPDGGWYDDPDRCPVAPIFRIGIYLINDMLRLLGPAESVQVMHSRLFTGRPTPDNAQLNIRFRNGVLGNIFASFCVNDGQFYSNTLVLNYENGTIFRNSGALPVGQSNREASMAVVSKHGAADAQIDRAAVHNVSGQYQWEAFQQAVRQQMPLETSIIDLVVDGIRVINAMARAEKSGKTELV